jgi:hypothetical protein
MLNKSRIDRVPFGSPDRDGFGGTAHSHLSVLDFYYCAKLIILRRHVCFPSVRPSGDPPFRYMVEWRRLVRHPSFY